MRWWRKWRVNAQENRYRDLWLVVISIVIVWLGSAALNASRDARRAAHRADAVASKFAQVARQAKTASEQAQANSDLAKDLAKSIQAQRESVTRDNCKAQNKHHDDTLREINRQLDQYIQQAHDPGRKLQLRGQRAATNTIINKLQPHQDCAAAVRRVQIKVRP